MLSHYFVEALLLPRREDVGPRTQGESRLQSFRSSLAVLYGWMIGAQQVACETPSPLIGGCATPT